MIVEESTNCNSSSHTIKLLSLSNNEKIPYSLLLLIGEVISTKTKILCKSKPELTICSGSNQTTTVLLDNTFKCSLQLIPGENIITLKYCNSTHQIRLIFEIPESIYSVLPVYIICKNDAGYYQGPETQKNTPETACKKISTMAQLIQTLYAEKLHQLGFGRKTFQFKNIEPGSKIPIPSMHESDLDVEVARSMPAEELWSYFGQELLRSPLSDRNVKYLAILSCTLYEGDKYDPNLDYDIKSLTKAGVALGGGGLALFGAGCLYSWPDTVNDVTKCFGDKTIVDRFKYLDDSSFR